MVCIAYCAPFSFSFSNDEYFALQFLKFYESKCIFIIFGEGILNRIR